MLHYCIRLSTKPSISLVSTTGVCPISVIIAFTCNGISARVQGAGTISTSGT